MDIIYILGNIRRDENMSEETREFLEAYKARRDLEEIIRRKDDEMKQKDDDLKKKDERIAELEAIIAAAGSTK